MLVKNIASGVKNISSEVKFSGVSREGQEFSHQIIVWFLHIVERLYILEVLQ